jgi:hypothetical protein
VLSARSVFFRAEPTNASNILAPVLAPHFAAVAAEDAALVVAAAACAAPATAEALPARYIAVNAASLESSCSKSSAAYANNAASAVTLEFANSKTLDEPLELLEPPLPPPSSPINPRLIGVPRPRKSLPAVECPSRAPIMPCCFGSFAIFVNISRRKISKSRVDFKAPSNSRVLRVAADEKNESWSSHNPLVTMAF